MNIHESEINSIREVLDLLEKINTNIESIGKNVDHILWGSRKEE